MLVVKGAMLELPDVLLEVEFGTPFSRKAANIRGSDCWKAWEMVWDRVSAEIVTEEGNEVKDDEEVEFDVVERADSSLRDEWVKPSRDAVHHVVRHVDQTFEETKKKKTTEDHKINVNGDELLAEKKNTEETEENGRQNPARRENWMRLGIT